MTPSSRIRRHIQSNVIGYLALFVAMSGTAMALPDHRTVKSDDLAKKSVKSKALASGAVKGRALAAGAVKNTKLAAGAVNAPKLADGAVVQGKLADAAVATAKLAEDAVTRQKIAQGAVSGGKLANGAVDSAKVDNASLQALDFGAGQISDGFAVSDTADAAGQDGVAFSTPYDPPRAGRLLITATTRASVDCAAACTRSLALYVDDVVVPQSTRTITIGGGGGTAVRDVTTSGRVDLTDAAHSIELGFVDSGAATGSFDDNAITGVLLQ